MKLGGLEGFDKKFKVELADRRTLVCNAVRDALANGRSLRPLHTGTAWGHEELSTEELEAALEELQALVRALEPFRPPAEPTHRWLASYRSAPET